MKELKRIIRGYVSGNSQYWVFYNTHLGAFANKIEMHEALLVGSHVLIRMPTQTGWVYEKYTYNGAPLEEGEEGLEFLLLKDHVGEVSEVEWDSAWKKSK